MVELNRQENWCKGRAVLFGCAYLISSAQLHHLFYVEYVSKRHWRRANRPPRARVVPYSPPQKTMAWMAARVLLTPLSQKVLQQPHSRPLQHAQENTQRQ